MTFLRVGTACAVIDDANRILLSRRGDMNVWNLPTGRLDAGEMLADCAVREAREETGVIAQVKHPLGLYYFEATQRLNLLFVAEPIGGEVVNSTDESTGNQYFAAGDLPRTLFAEYMAHNAFAGKTALHIHTTPPLEMLQLRFKLGQRWLMNLLRGHPEPRHIRFDVHAVAVIWDVTHRHVLVSSEGYRHSAVNCSGKQAPWIELGMTLKHELVDEVTLRWVGIWQQPQTNRIDLVFAATATASVVSDSLKWLPAAATNVPQPDADYIRFTQPEYKQAPVWVLVDDKVATA